MIACGALCYHPSPSVSRASTWKGSAPAMDSPAHSSSSARSRQCPDRALPDRAGVTLPYSSAAQLDRPTRLGPSTSLPGSLGGMASTGRECYGTILLGSRGAHHQQPRDPRQALAESRCAPSLAITSGLVTSKTPMQGSLEAARLDDRTQAQPYYQLTARLDRGRKA